MNHEVLYCNVLGGETISIDIIIPIYNTEKYVLRTVMSAIDGFADRHLIIVDDCSTDNSRQEIINFCKTHSTLVTFIGQYNNSGLSASRNIGNKYTKSELVCFLDSDDLHNSGILEIGIQLMKNHTEVEVLQFNALHFSDQTYKNWSFGHQALFDEIPNLQFSKNIDPGQLLFAEPNAALKILRGELIRREQLEYPEGRKFEDYAFHVKSLLNAKNVAIVNATLLFQRMNRSGNQITSSRDTSRFDILDELEISFKEINFINDSKANKEFLRLVIRSVDWCARMLPSQHLNKFAEKYFAIMSSQKKFLLEIKVPDLRLSFTENMTLIALQRGSKQLWVDLILRNPSFKMLLAVRRMAMDSKHIRKISRILGA